MVAGGYGLAGYENVVDAVLGATLPATRD